MSKDNRKKSCINCGDPEFTWKDYVAITLVFFFLLELISLIINMNQ